jgi:sulfoxide reductase heme-binding subunit YedZ
MVTSARPVTARSAASLPDPWLKPGIFLGALTPLVSIVIRALSGGLNANPIAEVENELGLSALIFLVASLACTPARYVMHWTWPVRVRRELGLFAFFYASLHFLVYVFLDQALDLGAIFLDIAKRPFITVGFLALVLLTPLALTSTKASVRRLGFKRWNRLHQLAYVAGLLAVIHFIWRVKIDFTQPLIYGLALGVLLLVRLGYWFSKRTK